MAVLLSSLLLAGCTQEITAIFANPCDSQLTIATYSTDDPTRASPGTLSKQVRLEPLSTTKVPNAFQYWGGPKRWLVGLVGSSDYVTVNGDTWIDNIVIIPARFCPSALAPADPSPSPRTAPAVPTAATPPTTASG